MIRVQRHFPRLVVAMLVLALGAAPLLLQTGAWGLMLVEYSLDNSFTHAVEMTFDGQHPCARCRNIQSQQEGKQTQRSVVPTRVVMVLFHETTEWRMAPAETMLSLQRGHDSAFLVVRGQKPAVPPPRVCA
jgi:hypothetical protein